nr:hypothetical protein [Tanacetum cinerariifolium]
FQIASKDLDSLLESQRLDKNKEGLGYSDVHPPPAQIYSPPKKDMSWTGLLEFVDNTVTDYSRPAHTVESSPDDAQNRNPSVTATEASPCTILPKPFIKFVKGADCTKVKTNKVEVVRKSSRVQRLERELKARTSIQKIDRGRSRCSIKFREGLLGIKCSKSFPLPVRFPTASYEDPLLREEEKKDAKDPGNEDNEESIVSQEKDLNFNSTGGGPRCQETIRDTIAQTRVLDLEKTKTTQRNKIDSLKRRVKKLEKSNRSRTHKLQRLYYKGRRIDVIDADEDITLDKGKEIMIEEPVKPKKKYQIRLNKEAAKKLQAKFDEKERLAREKAKKE